ncbi:hypothetical protein ACOAL9_14335 [Pseudomonas aeruginosa]|uniref:hypothetical protein n=1 Tax=Pseudomonas aeruginosa TaxID=287 RepID=UPI003B28C635
MLVFTHDAVFLTELAMALQRADRSASYKTIGWDESPGLVSEGLTWATMDTKARLADLESRAKALNVPVGSDPDDELERQIASGYSSLRGTVERAIREVFLNNTVQPFSDVVSVEAFGAVIGHPARSGGSSCWQCMRGPAKLPRPTTPQASANYRFPRARSCSAISPRSWN